jgi:hypothetical protein
MHWVSTYPAEGLYRAHRAGLNGSNPETIHEVTNPVAGIALNLLAGKSMPLRARQLSAEPLRKLGPTTRPIRLSCSRGSFVAGLA